MSQRRLHSMRIQYEEKLTSLQMKIKETEMERDRVLSSISESLGMGVGGWGREETGLSLLSVGNVWKDLLRFES